MMYTMPKNLLSICVNFALATQLEIKDVKTAYFGEYSKTAAPQSTAVRAGKAVRTVRSSLRRRLQAT